MKTIRSSETSGISSRMRKFHIPEETSLSKKTFVAAVKTSKLRGSVSAGVLYPLR
jgi:tRNA-binding EMAP/Myf-like protein